MGEGNNQGVTFGLKTAYGSGAVADGVQNGVFSSFLLFYYTGVLGLSGGLAGTALFLGMCFDAVSDPLVGYLSDHTRSRWGRRHPWMYAAIVPLGVSLYFLMAPPPGLDQTGLFLWMTGFAIAVRVALTLHMLPRNALVAEMSRDYDERTSLISAGFLLGWCGGLLLGQLAWFVIIPAFPGRRMDPDPYRIIGAVAAVMASASVLVSALGTHRLIPSLRAPAEVQLGVAPFLQEVGNALRNRSFRTILIGGMIVSVAANFQEVFGLYMNTYFWEFSDREMALFGLVLAVGVFVAVVVARPLTERTDKRTTALRLAAFLLVWSPLTIVARFVDLLPANGSTLLFAILAGHLLVSIIPGVAMAIILSAMFTDTIDENEVRTGLRQEGVFAAANAFMLKSVAGVGNLLGGFAIEWIDFPVQAAPGTVAPEKIMWLGIAAGPSLFLFYLAGYVFLSRYEITRERYAEIQRELLSRQGKPVD